MEGKRETAFYMTRSKIWSFVKKNWLIWTITVLGIAVVAPPVLLGLVILNAFFALALVCLQLSSLFVKSRSHKSLIKYSDKGWEPFVSIHLACHNESLKVVRKTLNALAHLDYRNYEVLIIDNNTTDPKLWKPLEEYCAQLGEKFRFFHFEHLDGFKAGALNVALSHMNPSTDIIALVDADYIVNSSFVKDSIPYFQDPDVALVQYPQDYSTINHRNQALGLEYRSFFTNLLRQADSWEAVTMTGVMGLLRADLFQKGLRWNEKCITEDAEVGVQLYQLGLQGIFMDRSMGQGLMPFDYFSLWRQRQRWVFGNMQILLRQGWKILFNQKLSWRQRWSLLAQLTAWFHPNLIPIIALIVSLVLLSARPSQFLVGAAWVSMGTLLLFLFGKGLYFVGALYRARCLTWHLWWETLLTHFGLSGVMSTAWLRALLIPALPFHRTNKDPEAGTTRVVRTEIVWASGLLLVGALAAIRTGNILLPLFAIVLGLFFVAAARKLQFELNATRELTIERGYAAE